MALLSCRCRNVVISVNEVPIAFTVTEFANRSNLLPHVPDEDDAFPFLGSNETMAPVRLALGGIKVVYPDLLIKREVGPSVLSKCAICSVYTHATDPSQPQDRSILINLGLERDPMRLRQAANFSSVFDIVIDEQNFGPTAQRLQNVNAHSQRGSLVRQIIAEVQNRSFESCQQKQREKEEKIREFTQQCNREYEDFQRRVNRDRDSLLRCIMSLSIPDPKPQTSERTQSGMQNSGDTGLIDNSGPFQSTDPRFPANQQSGLMRIKNRSETPVVSAGDLEDMDMVYGNDEVHSGSAFDASDDSNSSNESVTQVQSRIASRKEPTARSEVAQSAPLAVPSFQRRTSFDSDDDVDDVRPFDFRRMTLEAASFSRFANKSVASDGTELFDPFPDAMINNPPQ